MSVAVPMDDLLFLAHRIPYPPNKGDKIRSFHLLAYLSERYRIHLGAFVDQPDDWRFQSRLAPYCTSLWLGDLAPRRAQLRSLVGLATGEALTLPYYRRRGLSRWVLQQCRRHRIERILVYSSAMAQYVLGPEFKGRRRVVDFVDMDSDKWRQYSLSKRGPMAWIYRREGYRLATFEQRVAAESEASVFVSASEAALFRNGLAEGRERVHAVSNGVDMAYFSPRDDRPSPYPAKAPRLVFTGAMDYWANVEGVTWFVREVLPSVQRRVPETQFYIVGMNPSPAVRRLADCPGVVVTGAVADVRPYLQQADGVVVPLRIARGIQNKVLEAMAMGRPIVTTPPALEGIPAEHGRDLLVAAAADQFATHALTVLAGAGAHLGRSARALVERHFAWERSLPKYVELLEGRG